jgi:hypothetical protein
MRVGEINRSLEKYEAIREFVLMPCDFPVDVRSVTVFQKIKIDRKAAEERYREVIQAIYAPAAQGERA